MDRNAHLKRITPTRLQMAVANVSQKNLRELLDGGRFGARITKSYLSGSFGRRTATRPLDDVDIIFETDLGAWEKAWWRARPPPSKVLDSFERAMRYRYPNSSLRRQRRSVCLRLKHLNIDVVPGVATGEGAVILIPDRGDDKWLQTAPKLHAAALKEADTNCAGLAKPVIRILKHWNGRLPASTQTKSFVIESVAVRVFKQYGIKNLREGLLHVWDFLAHLGDEDTYFDWSDDQLGVSADSRGLFVEDTSGLGGNVAAGVDADHLANLARHARYARKKLSGARRSQSEEAAILRMEKLFGS